MTSPRPAKAPRPRRARAGGDAVEIALCLPILLILVGAVIDLAVFVRNIAFVSRAAREGARVGSSVMEGPAPTGALIEQAAEDQAVLLLDELGHTCGLACNVTANWLLVETTWFVKVEVSIPFSPAVGLVRFLPDVATARFTMMTQQQ